MLLSQQQTIPCDSVNGLPYHVTQSTANHLSHTMSQVVSHSKGLGSFPDMSIRKLLQKWWHWDRHFCEYLCVSQSVSFQWYSMPIHTPITEAIWWQQLTVSVDHLADRWLPLPTVWSRPMSMVWAVRTGTWQSSVTRSESWQPTAPVLSPDTPTTANRWRLGWTHLEWWASQRPCMPACAWMNQVSYFSDRYSFTIYWQPPTC